ncbi:uncharacterized protein RNJ42_00863 [Nakaseomyces bracarensis]|uniref:uncharacterized protein n=1 Tax=Nakaseomyces bracarensis TaxID=273131 RepID=UPI0038729256
MFRVLLKMLLSGASTLFNEKTFASPYSFKLTEVITREKGKKDKSNHQLIVVRDEIPRRIEWLEKTLNFQLITQR